MARRKKSSRRSSSAILRLKKPKTDSKSKAKTESYRVTLSRYSKTSGRKKKGRSTMDDIEL